ncbi:MAG: flagellar hook-length control protein FliK [Betaproteobacteria bacterium]
MRVDEVRPGYGSLVVLADRRGEQLPLDSGVPFQAEVLEREGERVLLSLAGRLLRCETALPLEPGTAIWLAVKEASAQRATLALIDPAALESRNLEALPTVADLIASGVPVTPEAVRSVASLLSGEPRLAEVLSALSKLLQQADKAAALPTDSLPPDFLDKLQTTLESAFFRPPSLPSDAAALARQADLLVEVVDRLGVNRETRLAALLEQSPAGAQPATQPAGPAVGEDLKGLLLLLRQALAAPNPGQPGQAGANLRRLAAVVDEALHNLTGQRLLAPSLAGQGQERLELYLQIPLEVGERCHTAEIKLYREGGSRKRSSPLRPAALRVSCRLSTATLGPVRVDLALRLKGTSEAHLYLSAEPVLALFRAHEPELRDILRAAGLRLGRVSYSLLPASLPPDTGGGPPVRLSVIDLRL